MVNYEKRSENDGRAKAKLSATNTGKKLSEAHRLKIVEAVANGKMGGYSWTKRICYFALDGRVIYCRSYWEHLVAEYLDDKELLWEYETMIFSCDGLTYLPDFIVYEPDKQSYTVIEVKGWMTNKAKRKLDSFRNYFQANNIKFELWDEPTLKAKGILTKAALAKIYN